ncbi:nickel pincer cofactor biosynthesis protein LarC [Vallicoccus soli]|uniref:Pyridinium-3,5-bisthiocarboxylic acid mononucleotide nickel insertion protein n=1 Tax=Vallicoccus soli TaxID=2339232 RepID=A0A3A3YTN7_9ACTN|nr:nickel pincer cofactor biosynthesis protein LarC [Vallicoccus soli]RJK94844.1 nickel pincer cofactor biosynthesis protein LarC [Vallicoccus soli]
MSRLLWLDAGSGASGDMLLGALHDLGALDLAALVAALGVDVEVAAEPVDRAGLRATRVHVRPGPDQPHRRLADVIALLDAADLPGPVRDRAAAVFGRLARAEAAVHGTAPEEVHFHEVGAVDALVDVVGACWGLHALGAEVRSTPVALGGGTVRAAHGVLPVPGPAVLRLLADGAVPAHGGPVDVELCTPTGAALLAEHVTGWGPMPPLVVAAVGTGAGGRDLPGRPNALRAVLGTPLEEGDGTPYAVLLETNVDDLDPRLWPGVLAALLAAGASDAWLTPVLMKKGRPAHTLSVLCAPERAAACRRAVFTGTTTLGLREQRVAKHALERAFREVRVGGERVRVKLGLLHGAVVTAQPEWEDVAAAARALGRAERAVLEEAAAAARA